MGCAGTDREGGENATGSGTGAEVWSATHLDCPAYFRRRRWTAKAKKARRQWRMKFKDFVK